MFCFWLTGCYICIKTIHSVYSLYCVLFILSTDVKGWDLVVDYLYWYLPLNKFVVGFSPSIIAQRFIQVHEASLTFIEREFDGLECGIWGWERVSYILRFQFHFYIASSTDLSESLGFVKDLVVWILHIPALKSVQEERDAASSSCLTLSLPLFYCFLWYVCW